MASLRKLRLLFESSVDPVLELLEASLDHSVWANPDWAKATLVDLRFLKMFLFGMTAYNQEVSEEAPGYGVLNDMKLGSSETVLPNLYTQEDLTAMHDTIQTYKQEAREICTLVMGGRFECKPCQMGNDSESVLEYAEEAASLLNLMLENLGDLVSSKGFIASVKQQIVFIEEKLKLFEMFACVIAKQDSPDIAPQTEVIAHIYTCVFGILHHVCLYWISEVDESFASVPGSVFDEWLDTEPAVSKFLSTLVHSEYHGFTPQLIVSCVDFLLEHLDASTYRDIVREQLIFFLSFLVDPPYEDDTELAIEISAIWTEVIGVICIHEADLLSIFLYNMDQFKEHLRERCVLTPLSSPFISPKTYATGFLDSLITNLLKMLDGKLDFIPLVKQQVEIVYEQLGLIRPFIENNLEQLKEHKKLKDLWVRAVDVVYYSAYVTNLCPMNSRFLWYGMICLPKLIEDMNLVISEARKVQNTMSSNARLTRETESSNQAVAPRNEAYFVGFKQDLEEILNQLIRGGKELTIISISGMAGQGKTTLAKRIFNDSSVQYHFHKIAWYYVSKECNTGDLLANIKSQVSNDDVKLENPAIHDFSDTLRKSLKGKRYFIVLDDIWDVDVWQQVQSSFPNDGTGSRILFTSRNHDIASQAKRNSISHPLRPFSDKQSWELIKDIFSDCIPVEFVEVGKKIAGQCKGLPLAVSLIAPLLKRAGLELDFWKEVTQNVKSYLAGEGCMDIVELSYKYLPDHLKPGFLYFGAFPRGQNIRARKLKLLWIAERFVEEDLAEEYLDSLVSRNLAVVTERSSTGGIKSCNVHDLLYDLCIDKCRQDNFLHLADNSIVSSAGRYDFLHRICVNENGPFTVPENFTPTGEELQTSSTVQTLLFNSSSLKFRSLSPFLSNFKVLKVLQLGCDYVDEDEVPLDVWNNIHLRYLSCNGYIKNIPASIVNLWNLETLRIYSYDGISDIGIPDSLWEMESLKNVHIGRFTPCVTGSWRNKSAMSMAATRNIEVLKGINLEYSHGAEKFLKRFVRLRKLKCFCPLTDVCMWLSMFGSLEKLESLRMELRRYFWADLWVSGQVPSIFNFTINLKKLTLVALVLPWSVMSTIGKLPNLEVLKLLDHGCYGPVWHLGDEEFLKLKRLILCRDDSIERIDDSGCGDTPFPCLEKLFLTSCGKLDEIPSSFGSSCTLDTIDVTRSRKVIASVVKIVEDQQDMGNDNLQVFGL